ncbi:MAG: NfeD family protein [Proteobacteria bacterium]|nr:NfeD family protein [Pseudomonadota bacterium]
MTWFVVFALSAFGVWYWRHYSVQQRDLESALSPQRKGERFIGQVVTVPKGIANGSGRVQLGLQQWTLRGPDVPPGAQVRITGVDGRVLIVDRMPSR